MHFYGKSKIIRKVILEKVRITSKHNQSGRLDVHPDLCVSDTDFFKNHEFFCFLVQENLFFYDKIRKKLRVFPHTSSCGLVDKI